MEPFFTIIFPPKRICSMIQKASEVKCFLNALRLKYNAVFNVKVANGQGLRRMEVLAGEKAYKCVY